MWRVVAFFVACIRLWRRLLVADEICVFDVSQEHCYLVFTVCWVQSVQISGFSISLPRTINPSASRFVVLLFSQYGSSVQWKHMSFKLDKPRMPFGRRHVRFRTLAPFVCLASPYVRFESLKPLTVIGLTLILWQALSHWNSLNLHNNFLEMLMQLIRVYGSNHAPL